LSFLKKYTELSWFLCVYSLLWLFLGVAAEWGTSTEVSPTQSSIADVISVKKMLDEKDSTTSDDLIPGTPASSETSSVGVSVLLLYRRNDPQVSVRAADLRKRLQLDCGNQIKVGRNKKKEVSNSLSKLLLGLT
jgi:hypothetical protein